MKVLFNNSSCQHILYSVPKMKCLRNDISYKRSNIMTIGLLDKKDGL